MTRDGSPRGSLLETIYLFLRLNGALHAHNADKIIKEKIRTNNYGPSLFSLHHALFRYFEGLFKQSEILNHSSNFMNRLSRALAPFTIGDRDYNPLNAHYDTISLIEAILGRLDNSQIESIIMTETRAKHLMRFRQAIMVKIVRSRRYRLSFPITDRNNGLDSNYYRSSIVGKIVIGAKDRPAIPAKWNDPIISFIRNTSIRTWNGPINTITSQDEARRALWQFISLRSSKNY